ncbi:phospholipase ABHD3-like isoform X1 [Amphiura filiformis]|uniref:phospholipase ABHD3-like isoform X1 n=1 Tax=Amphiura filiformis TaxID=82378 RepID=UPI003B226200
MADLDSTRYISDLNQAWVALGIGLVYVIYYITFVVKKPLIICGNPRLRDFIDTNLPVLNEDYWPLFWCLNGKFQTLLKGVTNKTVRISVNWTYRRDVLVTPDGGEICLDWVDNDKKSLHLRDERPTVIIVPGLSGSSGEVYSVHFFELVQKLGYRSVVFNNRGLGGCRLKTPRTFCPKNTEDFRTVVQHIRKDYPNAPLFALGASAGGLNLFHYLADYGKDCQLNGAMIVSVLYEMFASTKNLETFPNVLLFNQTLIRDLHYDMLLPNQDILRTHKNLDVNSILQARTVRQFHTRLIVPTFGYKDWKQYYRDCNLTGLMHKIKIPTLFMNAADDPFTPLSSIPIEEMRKEENVILVLTSHGGHCGFMEGVLPTQSGYMCKVFSQYVNAIFKNDEQNNRVNEFER